MQIKSLNSTVTTNLSSPNPTAEGGKVEGERETNLWPEGGLCRRRGRGAGGGGRRRRGGGGGSKFSSGSDEFCFVYLGNAVGADIIFGCVFLFGSSITSKL
jgi:hypothetical protein